MFVPTNYFIQISCPLSLMFSFTKGYLKDFDGLGGVGWLGCFKLGPDGPLDGSLGRHGGRVIEIFLVHIGLYWNR